MNFLELVKRARQECGIAGDGPVTVLNQRAEMKRLVDWVAQAWVDLQTSKPDWLFLRKPFSFETVAGQSEYSATEAGITDFKRWRNDSFRIYLKSAGEASEVILHHCHSYDNFRDYYMLGAQRLVRARPTAVTITPERKLALGFTPDSVYVSSGEYYRNAQRLAMDNDVPIIPEDYHMLIVYGTMKKYGMFNVASEQIAIAREEYTQLYNQFLEEYGPTIDFGESLI